MLTNATAAAISGYSAQSKNHSPAPDVKVRTGTGQERMRMQPRPLPKLTKHDIDKFCDKIIYRGPDECWDWTSPRTQEGYGNLWLDGRGPYLIASRVSYFLEYGEDPYPDDVLHTCDRPSCCNPAHLFKGTQDDNMKDAVAKGRIPKGDDHYYRKHPEEIVRGERNGRSLYTAEQVLEMRRACRDNPKVSMREMARRFGVKWNTFHSLVSGENWKHLPL